jgi:hypothetical protein
MSPTKFDTARMKIQAAANAYEAAAGSINMRLMLDPGTPPANPDELLRELSQAMVMVINHLEDLSTVVPVDREARKRKATEVVSRYRPVVSTRDIDGANPENQYPEFNFTLGGEPLSKSEYDSIIAEFTANQIRAGIDSRVNPQ